MTKPVIVFDKREDEQVRVLVGRKVLYHGNYDELGWSGMEAVEEAVRAVATALGADVREM